MKSQDRAGISYRPADRRIADTISFMHDFAVALKAAHAGAAVVRERFGSSYDTEYKRKFDPVTDVDTAAEAAIVHVISTEKPADGILAEEGGGTAHDGRYWIIDPLDGTVNFVHSIPQVAVSVALWDGDQAVVGVVIDVLRNEVFTAQSGSGATLNGQQITVSNRSDLSRCVVGTGFPYDHDIHADALSVVVREVLREVNGLRRFGSAALDLAWVAAGRFDAYWELGIAPWDGAAGILLVREAGGMVTDPWGTASDPFKSLVIASNGVIHEDIRSIVHNHLPSHLEPE
jgi:myo-inositol-1(or 4)-monophosphatase